MGQPSSNEPLFIATTSFSVYFPPKLLKEFKTPYKLSLVFLLLLFYSLLHTNYLSFSSFTLSSFLPADLLLGASRP